MKEIIKKIIASLDNHTNGYSARKLTSLSVMLCVIAAHVKWLSLGDFNLLGEVLIIDYSFVAALLGMTTYQAIKKEQDA